MHLLFVICEKVLEVLFLILNILKVIRNLRSWIVYEILLSKKCNIFVTGNQVAILWNPQLLTKRNE